MHSLTRLCALSAMDMMNFRIFNRIMETRQSEFYCTQCFSEVPIEKRIRGMLFAEFHANFIHYVFFRTPPFCFVVKKSH